MTLLALALLLHLRRQEPIAGLSVLEKTLDGPSVQIIREQEKVVSFRDLYVEVDEVRPKRISWIFLPPPGVH